MVVVCISTERAVLFNTLSIFFATSSAYSLDMDHDASLTLKMCSYYN